MIHLRDLPLFRSDNIRAKVREKLLSDEVYRHLYTYLIQVA